MKNIITICLTFLINLGSYGQITQANYKSPLPDLQNQGWKIHSHSLSFDGQTIVFSAKPPKSKNYDLYHATKNGSQWENITPLASLNTQADELYPSLSSSQQDLIFVKRHVETLKGKKKLETYHLLSSSQTQTQWAAPEVIIISQGGDISPLIFPDNKTVIFASNRTAEGKKENNFALFYTYKMDQRNWYDPIMILAPENKNEHFYAPRWERSVRHGGVQTVTISYTRQVCSHRDTTYTQERFALPEKYHPLPILTLEGYTRDTKTRHGIPAQINVYHAISSKPLAQMHSSALGKYKLALPAGQPYFLDITAENYSHDYGDYDCTKLSTDTTVKNDVELAKQLNLRINAFDADILLPMTPDQILVNGLPSKQPNSEMDFLLHIGQIYDITYKKQGYEDTTLHINTQNSILLTQSELDVEMNPSKTDLMIQLVDADSLYAISGVIDIRNRDKDEDLVLQADSLQYAIHVRQGDYYQIYARAKGYVYKDTLLHVPYQDEPQYHTIPLPALRKAMVLQLRNIQFDYNSYDLTPSSFAELDRLVKLMQDNPSMHIELSAHTDDVGSERFNMLLSQKRGEAARKYLLRHGVEPERIVAKGYGKTKPLVPNDSEENRAINRRVEFTINEIQL